MPVTTVTIILWISIFLQITAAVLALRLIGVTKGRGAWIVIATAICLMALQRMAALSRYVSGAYPRPREISAELLALGISLLMVAGIAAIRPLFQAIADSQEDLRKERDFVAGVVDTVGALVVVLDREGQIIRFNRACEEITGYSFEEVKGEHFWDQFLTPEDMGPVKAVFDRMAGGEFPLQHECHWLTKAGEKRAIAWANTALVDADGAVEHIIATGIDVTERKQAVEELRAAQEELERRVEERTAALSESNELLKREIAERERAEETVRESQEALERSNRDLERVLETMGDGVMVLDADHRLVRANRKMCELLQYTEEELRGRDASFWTHSDSLSRMRDELAKRQRGEVSAYEAEYVRKDGSTFMGLATGAAILDAEGNHQGAVGCIKDITERLEAERALRESEARLQSILDNATAVVYIKDTDGRYVLVNRRFEELFHVTKEEIAGKTDHAVFPAELADDFRTNDREVLRKGKALEFDEVAMHDDGPHNYMSIKFPLRHVNGQVYALCGISTDITARKRAEELLARHSEELARSNAELEQFAYLASHDLQEPLRKVRAFGDRLNAKFSEAIPEQGQDYLNRMVNAAERMQTLINDLLRYSRVTTKAHPFVPVDLDEVVRQAVSDLEIQIERTSGTVNIGELPTVEADATQMRQLLQNLISNALKFRREDDDPVIEVRATVLTSDELRSREHPPPVDLSVAESFCELVVEDNGIGFDEKHRERIFGVFQRLHGREAYEGTGIGLAVCRKIAERHGGAVTASSPSDTGSKFTVIMPVKHPKAEEEGSE